jgi:hypothetical protein
MVVVKNERLVGQVLLWAGGNTELRRILGRLLQRYFDFQDLNCTAIMWKSFNFGRSRMIVLLCDLMPRIPIGEAAGLAAKILERLPCPMPYFFHQFHLGICLDCGCSSARARIFRPLTIARGFEWSFTHSGYCFGFSPNAARC